MKARRALVVGHFSTVGDVDSVEIVRQWCEKAQLPYDLSPYSKTLQTLIDGAVAPDKADPAKYSHLMIVCGPCCSELLRRNGLDIDRFSHCHRIGVNLTMVAPLSEWNPFDLLLERDSTDDARPDLTFAYKFEKRPVVARCIIARQREYGARQRHARSLELIDGLITRRLLPSIEISTDRSSTDNMRIPNSASALSSLMARADVLLTNRLHGLVYGLRSGVPTIAIDAVAGGDKLTAQAKALNWPICFLADEATDDKLNAALDWCLTEEARKQAADVCARAIDIASQYENRVLPTLALAAMEEFVAPHQSGKRRFSSIFGG